MENDIKALCRLCLVKPEFSENIICNDKLKAKFRTLFNIVLHSNDEFPSLVCCSCLQVVENFSKFRDQVAVNQDELRRKISNPAKNENFIFSNDDFNDDDIDHLNVSHPTSADETDLKDDERFDSKLEILHINVDAQVDRKTRGPFANQQDNDTDDSTSTEPELDKVVKKSKRRQVESDYDDRIREFMTLFCDQCEKRQVYDTFKQLSEHFKRVHQTRAYITCCDKKFYRKDILVSHITGHINPEAYKCELCGKISKSKSLLQTHMKVHLPVDQREYECPTCNQRFATKSHLTKHKISHLPDSEKKFSCEECGKAFGVKNALTQHKLTHSSERNFVCEDCGRSFAVKSYLQNHINNIHNNEPKPKLQCHICQSWFKNNDTLRKHVRQHNDQTQYKCEYCDKVCSSRDVWWCHVRFVHKKIRQHECNICDRKFRRRYELTEHMAKHTGQPLYKCQYCGRQFMYSSHFSQHRKKCQLLSQEQEQQQHMEDHAQSNNF